MAKTSTQRVRDKRERARLAGLCIACFRPHIEPGRATCRDCSAGAVKRVAQLRDRRRARKLHALAISKFEAKGNAARDRYAYLEAVNWYERAFEQNTDSDAEARLCLNVGHSLGYCARPNLATPWLERALERFLQNEIHEEAA